MTTTELAARSCGPCSGKSAALPPEQIKHLLPLVPAWTISQDGTRIARSWRVRDFLTAMDFFRRITDVAEAEDHHPDLHLTEYRHVTVELWTHAAGGLTENDFILAAKIDSLGVEEKG